MNAQKILTQDSRSADEVRWFLIQIIFPKLLVGTNQRRNVGQMNANLISDFFLAHSGIGHRTTARCLGRPAEVKARSNRE